MLMTKHGVLPHLLSILASFVLLLLFTIPGRADIAPPESPSGGNPRPDGETTQVRMVSEAVTLVVKENPPPGSLGQAQVTAVFEMANMGSAGEVLQVRFPLTFPDGRTDDSGNFPEIKNLQVKVNGYTRQVQRETIESPEDSRPALPWAVFEADFPAGEAVQIEVIYLQEAWGEYPYLVFGYVLETGRGWQGTIGSAELVVRLPYEVNEQNVIFEGSVGFGGTSPGAVAAGNELRWQRSDFEPSYEDNLSVLVLAPEAWKEILAERAATRRNPQDGEAWGRLGKACKEASRLRRGFREDLGGLSLYMESAAAYEHAVTRLPEDALWHFGFAELLWNHYVFHVYIPYEHDQSELLRAVGELKASLDLDPDEPRALELAQEVAWLRDGLIDLESDRIDYPLLTATPVYPTREPTLAIIEVTGIPDPTFTPLPPPTNTLAPALVEPTQTPAALGQLPAETEAVPALGEFQEGPSGQGSSPLCGGLFVPLLLLLAIRCARHRE
jgi:hypothetical protein